MLIGVIDTFDKRGKLNAPASWLFSPPPSGLLPPPPPPFSALLSFVSDMVVPKLSSTLTSASVEEIWKLFLFVTI